MFGFNWQQGRTKQWLASALAGVLVLSAVGCSDRGAAAVPPVNIQTSKPSVIQRSKQISEVSPPATIQALRQELEQYRPQVKIVSPRADAVLEDTQVAVKFEVRDLPIFKDPDLGLGPHLHVFVDDQPYQAVYDLTQPLILKDLSPGSHTLRVFASRPWHESFKNEGAYAQTTFHVFTATLDNQVDSQVPLLTYSRPQGSYGAEPVMVDFYLTNAPLHFVAQDNPADEIRDWQIRCTVNGESFEIDRWQPIYLKGLKPGKNWVKLELIDEKGQPIENTFNNVARVVEYQPGGSDALSRLVRGDLTVREARGIVDPNYVPEPEPVVEIPPAIAPTPEPSPSPEPDLPEAIAPEAAPTLTPEVLPKRPAETPAAPSPEAAPAQGLFGRFRRRPAEPVMPIPGALPEEESPIQVEPETVPEPAVKSLLEKQADESEAPATVEEPAIAPEPAPTLPSREPAQSFWSRFRRQPIEETPAEPRPVPAIPSALEAPESPEAVELEPVESEEAPSLETEMPMPEAIAPEPAKPEAKGKGVFDFFKRSPAPAAPEPKVLELPDLETPPEASPGEMSAETQDTVPEEPVVASEEQKPTAPTKSLFDFFKRSPAPSPAPTLAPELPASLSAPQVEAEPVESPAETTSEDNSLENKAQPKSPSALPIPEADSKGRFWTRMRQPFSPSAPAEPTQRFSDRLKQAEPVEQPTVPEIVPSAEAPEPSAMPAPTPTEPERTEQATPESTAEPDVMLPRSPFDSLLPSVLPGASTAAESANALKAGQPLRVITAPTETAVPARYRRSVEPEPEAIAPETEATTPETDEDESSGM